MFGNLRDYSNLNSLGSRLRKKRFKHIEKLVEKALVENEVCRILDVGGSAQC